MAVRPSPFAAADLLTRITAHLGLDDIRALAAAERPAARLLCPALGRAHTPALRRVRAYCHVQTRLRRVADPFRDERRFCKSLARVRWQRCEAAVLRAALPRLLREQGPVRPERLVRAAMGKDRIVLVAALLDIVEAEALDRKGRPHGRAEPPVLEGMVLAWAAGAGHMELVERLLPRRAHDEQDMSMALHDAAAGGAIDAARLILFHPLAVHRSPIQDPLIHAVENADEAMVRLLLSHPKTVPPVEAIRMASWLGSLRVVSALLEHPLVDPGIEDDASVRLAAERGHADVVRRLLAHPGVDPTAKDNYALRWAANNLHVDVVELLLRCPSVAASRNALAIAAAACKDDPGVMRVVCESIERTGGKRPRWAR